VKKVITPRNILYRLPAAWLVPGRGGGGGAARRPSSIPRYKRSSNGTCPAMDRGRASRLGLDLKTSGPARVHKHTQTYIAEAAMVLSVCVVQFPKP
jgi:hypothetical protein